jgi:hypothetical protein
MLVDVLLRLKQFDTLCGGASSATRAMFNLRNAEPKCKGFIQKGTNSEGLGFAFR